MKFNRIGFYFGSFNPMHIGHLFVIEEALKIAIDKLYIIVSPQSPFKNKYDLAPFEDRLEMAKLVVNKKGLVGRVEVVDWERDRYPSYTIETLEYAKKLLGIDNEYVIFMGLDNFVSIDTWKYSENIVRNYSIHVIPRDTEDAVGIIRSKTDTLKKLFGKVKSVSYGNPFNMLSISATDLRKMLREGKDLPEGLIIKDVEEYIKEKKLYI